ncbi:hypothetical protein D3C85_960550 [compost metagenome]
MPEPDHGWTGVDALPRRAADTGRLGRACFGVGVDVHAGNAEALAGERPGIRGERLVGGRTHRGDAWNGHPGLQPPQVAPRVGIVRHHHVQHFEEVRHRPGIGHDDIHGRRQRPVPTHRDHTARRGVGAQAIVRGRAASARPGFLGQAECGETGGRCGACAVRGTRGEGGGEVVSIVRALRPAIDPALHATVGHGRHVGLAQADGTCGTQPFDGERIAIGHQVGEGGAARRRRKPLHQVTVLGGVRDAIEWPKHFAAGTTGVAGLGFVECLGVAHHHRIQGGGGSGAVVGVDPGEIGLHQFDCRCLA